MIQKWPQRLVLVRHGETLLNVERERLKKKPTKELIIKTPCRDMDIPLTKRGMKQARTLGQALKKYPKFDTFLVSPYVRTEQTAKAIIKELNYKPKIISEERIREKDWGILDRLTERGRKRYHPKEVERKKWEGDYYYRIPGGENYPDVALRVHSLLGTLVREYKKRNVLVVTHSIVILMFRKLLERLCEKEILEVHSKDTVKNCSITAFFYDKKSKGLLLKEWNKVFGE